MNINIIRFELFDMSRNMKKGRKKLMISFYFRFESVHPSIYAIYDLIEHIPDPLLAQQIREHVVCIEGKKYKPFFLRFLIRYTSIMLTITSIKTY